MHAPDGTISHELVVTGFVVAGGVGLLTLRRLPDIEIPRVAVMGSAVFVASLASIPILGVPLHATLNGLAGVVLGPASFLAVGVAVVLQALLFGHGGVTTMGFNVCVMGLPAMAVGWGFRRWVRRRRGRPAGALRFGSAGFVSGAVAGGLSALILVGGLVESGEEIGRVGRFLALGILPIMLFEGAVTSVAVGFLGRVQPALLVGAGAFAFSLFIGTAALASAPTPHVLKLDWSHHDERLDLLVYDPLSGAGAPELEVEVRSSQGLVASGVTDAEGRFSCEWDGAHSLRVVASGLADRVAAIIPRTRDSFGAESGSSSGAVGTVEAGLPGALPVEDRDGIDLGASPKGAEGARTADGPEPLQPKRDPLPIGELVLGLALIFSVAALWLAVRLERRVRQLEHQDRDRS